jgi:hypothetical protein
MRRHPIPALQLMMTVLLIASLFACDKEKITQTYTWYTPVYRTLPEVRANMKSSPARAIKAPGKIYIYGNYIFLNEFDEGIHIFDNSQPSSPQNLAFIPIPGSQDLAVKGNFLFADSYSDLVTFDISDPKAVKAIKFTDNALPFRNAFYSFTGARPANVDSIRVTVDWVRHDTTVSYTRSRNVVYETTFALANSTAQPSKSSNGQGGSMARFTLINDYLYTVSTSDLHCFNISNPGDPKFVKKTNIDNWTIETIYPFKNKLFIGSATGMFIYDVSTPGNPVKQGQFTHARSCDPVIADDTRAYVTLRSGNTCGGFSNQLDVLDITDVTKPSLIKTYSMTNPFGLGKEGNTLFICDGKDGVKVYDAYNSNDIKLINKIEGMEPYDVIAWNKIALIVAKDGLYQYDYSDVNNIRLLSKISFEAE